MVMLENERFEKRSNWSLTNELSSSPGISHHGLEFQGDMGAFSGEQFQWKRLNVILSWVTDMYGQCWTLRARVRPKQCRHEAAQVQHRQQQPLKGGTRGSSAEVNIMTSFPWQFCAGA